MTTYRGPKGTAHRIEDIPNPWCLTWLDCWLMDLPNQAPLPRAWDQYQLVLVHLRPGEMLMPARKDFEEATHEISVMTLDPGSRVTPETPWPWRLMTPANVRVQFAVGSDEAARHVAEECARACAEGILPGETSIYLYPGPDHPDGKIMLIQELLDLWTEVVRTTAAQSQRS